MYWNDVVNYNQVFMCLRHFRKIRVCLVIYRLNQEDNMRGSSSINFYIIWGNESLGSGQL